MPRRSRPAAGNRWRLLRPAALPDGPPPRAAIETPRDRTLPRGAARAAAPRRCGGPAPCRYSPRASLSGGGAIALLEVHHLRRLGGRIAPRGAGAIGDIAGAHHVAERAELLGRVPGIERELLDV